MRELHQREGRLMARIRSVHPGLFTDESFMTLTVESPIAIALLIGLWVEADDSGTFEWKPLTLKARILPVATADISDLLAVIERVGMIRKFEFGGKPFGVIRNFVKYQRPKDPKDIHPYSEGSRLFAGFASEGARPNATKGRKPFGTNSESIPNSPGIGSEIRAQREDGGGKREEEVTSSVASSPDGRPRPRSRAELDRIEHACREAAGVVDSPNAPGKFYDLSVILGFIDAGVSLEETILPVLKAKKAKGSKAFSWDFFTEPIREAAAKRAGTAASCPPPPAPGDEIVNWGHHKMPAKNLEIALRKFAVDPNSWLAIWGEVPSKIPALVEFAGERGIEIGAAR